MKKLLHILITFAFMYVAGYFITDYFNPLKWHVAIQTFLGIFWAVISLSILTENYNE